LNISNLESVLQGEPVKHAKWLLPITLGLALSTTRAQTQITTLELNQNQGQSLSSLALSGYNLGNYMNVIEFPKQLRALEPSLVRFPAGNVGDDQDLSESSLRTFKANLSIFGKQQPKIMVQTRVFGRNSDAKNRPQDAADAARAAIKLGLKIDYWNIGNEPDLYAVTRGDKSWTADKYCDTFRAQRTAILAVQPDAKFAGPSTTAYPEFLERFVERCGDIVDVLTWHEYPTDGRASDETAIASITKVSSDIERYLNLWKDKTRNPLGFARAIDFGLTEYGLSYRTDSSRHISDQLAGLWAAETTLRMAEAGAKLNTYFALQGVGPHGTIDISGVPRPTYYAFQHLKHFTGESLKLSSGNKDLWLHAAKNKNTLQIIAINTATNGSSLALDIPGWEVTGAKGFTEDTVKNEAPDIRFNTTKALELPARSLVRIAYKQVIPSLRSLASAKGVNIGVAVGPTLFDEFEPEYAETLAKEFNMVVPENAMKWGAVQPAPDQYAWALPNAIVKIAQQNKQKIRGHTLVWHEQLPNWVLQINDRDTMLAALKDHIQTTVKHFKGQIDTWDVINEAISDSGGLRNTPFLKTIGKEYFELAFRWAHEADPDAKLFYNDYNTDGINRKSDDVYELVKDLKAKGVPITGVGFQAHIDAGFNVVSQRVLENYQRFRDLGLEIQITELDVQSSSSYPANEHLTRQAKVYSDMLETCLKVRCSAFMMWGLTDAHSWRAGRSPLIFDGSYAPKPAYDALIRVLQEAK
jgi:GH35 family endo-1,4-beta-xylanase